MAAFFLDPNSQSNLTQLTQRHIHMNLGLDFKTHVISGRVWILFEVCNEAVEKVVVDTRDLAITAVHEDGVKAHWVLDSHDHKAFGKALHIDLSKKQRKLGDKITIDIEYATSPNASAIQWLSPDQTAGKKHPFLFTQCQAIHARSLVPCVDSPAAKCTYSAHVTVEKPLRALMSAYNVSDALCPAAPEWVKALPRPAVPADHELFSFYQPIVMPTYLIALSAGQLESRTIGPRSVVWSEPEMVDKGAFEFAETEQYLQAGEQILGPYVWGRYDILLLPPSFPYGGMENPMLTFVTPSLLAGDRSLANVVAHEIAHSWTGNFVTNRYWIDFWLNEGFTVWTERQIMKKLKGPAYYALEALIGLKALHESIEAFGHDCPLTNLRPRLEGIDPDDAFSSVPYEKGFNFLTYLENLVGEAHFAVFMKTYIKNFAYQSITSEDFRSYFLGYFSAPSFQTAVAPETDSVAARIATVDWERWFNTPGEPLVHNHFDKALASAAEALAQHWAHFKGGAPSFDASIASWESKQVIYFLEKLESSCPLPPATIDAINAQYNFVASKNAEVLNKYFMVLLRSENLSAVEAMKGFLRNMGRMKFNRNLFRFWKKLDAEHARKFFAEIRNNYHPICSKMIEKDLA